MKSEISLLLSVWFAVFCISSAWAGGTNSVFLRLENMVQEMEGSRYLSPEEANAWRLEIKTLRDKVDERIKKNGGGMNRHQDKDLYDEIDTEGKKIFSLYQHYKQSKPRR
ncbi:MAG TPA: hypothetical protein V6C99_12550 [Oculatellaceae cyanobacterium]